MIEKHEKDKINKKGKEEKKKNTGEKNTHTKPPHPPPDIPIPLHRQTHEQQNHPLLCSLMPTVDRNPLIQFRTGVLVKDFIDETCFGVVERVGNEGEDEREQFDGEVGELGHLV